MAKHQEVMGDAVLNLVILEKLIEMFPHESDGAISRRRAHLVSHQMRDQVTRALNADPAPCNAAPCSIASISIASTIGALYSGSQATPHNIDACRSFITKYWDVHNGGEKPPNSSVYVNDAIKSMNLHVWLEANDFAELGFMANSSTKCPSKDLARRALSNQHKGLSLIDVRRRMPFLLFDSIINYFTFIQIYGILFKFREDMPDSGKASAIFSVLKRFERLVFKNLSSRDRCFRILHAFIDDTKPMPVWFQKSISEFEDLGLPKTQNPIHMVMRKMDPSHVKAVQDYVMAYWKSSVDHSQFSPAMRSALSTQANKPDEMVLDRYKDDLKFFFVRVFQTLMDAYVVCKMLSEPSRSARVFLAGESHVQNVMHMLLHIGAVRDTSTAPYTINVKNGVIDIANKVPVMHQAINGHPKLLMKAFRLKRARKLVT